MIIFTVLLSAVVICRCILLQKCHRRWKIFFSAAALIIAGKFYVLRVCSGSSSLFNPELPPWILLPFAWLFALLLFFCIWLVFYDVASWLIKRFCRWKKRQEPDFLHNHFLRLYGLIPAAILVSYGLYEGTKLPEVFEYTLEVKNLPEEFNGLRIVHLTDLHADPISGKEKLGVIVDIANRQQADLIVITGDFVDGRTAVRANEVKVLHRLNAPLGVYGVPGNHEYYSGYDEWMAQFEANGIKMLKNEHIMLGEKFAIGGVTDIAAIKRSKQGKFALPDVDKTFAGTPENCFRLLLAHQPKIALEASGKQVDLQLSGHTHGGMIRGMDMMVAIFNCGWVSGAYDVNGMTLFISNGTGIWGGFPIRLGRRSEIAVITLKRR